ncbi:MAG TPA: pyridoxamine 5'-phosphate oxidase family protein [Chloroflexota bacterium]|nr:pyridoxamine 5'-phosphate oxidase family protein [Chloroflexota bacterium]
MSPVAELFTAGSEDVSPLPWEEGQKRIAENRIYWLTTVRPSGRPHTRPVLAVWVGDALYTTSSASARKGRNLEANPSCSVAVMAEDMHIVLEGEASRVTSETRLEQVAQAYRDKYSWPVSIVEGGFEAPYAAPAAGASPYQPYEITPSIVFGWVTSDAEDGWEERHTRWRF